MNEFNPNPSPNSNDGSGASLASLILGVLGLVGGFIPIVRYFTLICAILAIVFGVSGKKQSRAVYGTASGMATAGVVLGIISIALTVLLIIITAIAGAAIASVIRAVA